MWKASDQSQFEEELDSIHQRYLRQDLEDRLEDVATEMEETMLQAIIARNFLSLGIAVSDDAKGQVREAKRFADERKFDVLDEVIDDVEDKVSQEAQEVQDAIQEERTGERDRVRAMRKLNEYVEATDKSQLKALESLLDDWDWKAHVYTNESQDSFEAKQQEAHEVAETMSSALRQVQDDLLGSYSGTSLADVMDQLLSDDRFYFNDLTAEERKALTGSNLADHLEIRLG
ncbi:hypothetical protein [Halosimplex salinum]|uniref:hypothetical protein n=1 Tax=Halosimplex salinum TaxID=1710538 RepID=UPI000F489D74|nr:hypothetical protein [Halosimplex salinum]